MIANGIFNSVLSYCMPLWGGCNKEDIDSLQVLKNRAAQIVSRLPLRTSRKNMFHQIGWLLVKQMIVYFSTIAVFKIRMPAELARIFRNVSQTGRITLKPARIQLVQDWFVYKHKCDSNFDFKL